MNAQETPTASVKSKKRELSSPEFETDIKKNKAALSSSSISDLDISEIPEAEVNLVMAEQNGQGELSTPHITIPPSEMLKLSEMLKDTFKGEIANLVDSVVQGVLKGLNERIDILEKNNADLIKQNKDLAARVKVLEKSADKAEQYSRRNCLRVSGFPETPAEDTDALVLKMARDIGCGIQLSDIDRSHRIGKPDGRHDRPREVIVKFATYRARQMLYKMRTALKNNGYMGVFLNEDLTKIRSDALYEARKTVKAGRAKGAWTSDGVILIKDLADVVHRITCKSDISRIDFPTTPIVEDVQG